MRRKTEEKKQDNDDDDDDEEEDISQYYSEMGIYDETDISSPCMDMTSADSNHNNYNLHT